MQIPGEDLHDSYNHLSTRQVLMLHVDQTTRFGGLRGVRMTRLRSAVGAVKQTFDGQLLIDTVEEIAASYIFYIIQDHPFKDCNERTGVACGLAFLRLNGFSREQLLGIDSRRLAALAHGIARGFFDRDRSTYWLMELLDEAGAYSDMIVSLN